MEIEYVLAFLFFIISILYSLVGHGGGSGYIAIMGLVGVLPIVIKPTALVLNIVVSGIAFYHFYRARYFKWSLFWPFVLGSIPLAYIGGGITLPNQIYKWIVGIVLLFSAYRLLFPGSHVDKEIKSPPTFIAIVVGMVIGLLSGLIGVGGGIFLSPLLLFLGWAKLKEISAVAAAFVFINSVSGLSGHISSVQNLPNMIGFYALIVLVGGIIGSRLGSVVLPDTKIKKILGIVLSVGGLKMIFL